MAERDWLAFTAEIDSLGQTIVKYPDGVWFIAGEFELALIKEVLRLRETCEKLLVVNSNDRKAAEEEQKRAWTTVLEVEAERDTLRIENAQLLARAQAAESDNAALMVTIQEYAKEGLGSGILASPHPGAPLLEELNRAEERAEHRRKELCKSAAERTTLLQERERKDGLLKRALEALGWLVFAVNDAGETDPVCRNLREQAAQRHLGVLLAAIREEVKGK